MPIIKYFIYKCKKCDYKKTSFESDITIVLPKRCLKWGGEMEIVDSSFSIPLGSVVSDILEKIFKRIV